MSELTAALRAGGHDDIAAALERKELAGRLRGVDRDDLADQLESGTRSTASSTAPSTTPQTPEQQLGQQLLDNLNANTTPWLELGAKEESGGE